MEITTKSFYIIKQANGTTWNFLYDEDEGIIYKFFKENKCSDYNILTKTAQNNFSVFLLPDDSINVLYKDFTETIVLMKYIEDIWTEQEIMKNSEPEVFDVDFKAAVYNNRINMIFSILNKKDNTVTLLHEILNKENNLTNAKIIEKLENEHYISFNIYSIENKGLFVMYQRFSGQFRLGYKFFDKNTKEWSNFNLIDTSIYPFRNYSTLITNGMLSTLYIKKEKNIDKLIYAHGKNSAFKKIELFSDINIELCSFFIVFGQIWCYWIKNNIIYNSFSINNGNDFSSYPYEQILNYQFLFKVIYIYNKLEEPKNVYANEIYVSNYDDIKYLIFSNLYSYTINNIKNKEYLSYIEYYMVQICEKVLSYEKKLKEKETSINELNQKFEKEKLKLLSSENENMLTTQKNLIAKEDTLNFFENENIKKEKEIFSLKSELSNQENRILSLLEEIKNLQDDINNLNSQFTRTNSKIKTWFSKKIFKIKQYISHKIS